MRNILLIFACLAFGSLAAETIGNVEYHLLPNKEQGWKLASELQGNKETPSTTIVYVPENTPKTASQEFFIAHTNDCSVDLTDKDVLKKEIEKGIQINSANRVVKINLIEGDSRSVLYEWSLNDSDLEKSHGWTRVFSAPNQTVMLTYLTEQLSNIEEKRPIWIQSLKDAKVIK